MKLMDQLPRRAAQIAASLDQLVPEVFGRGLQRQRTKRVADLSQQQR
jgi:hypothetical protein